jgi:ArsR family transcriptional regulator
MQTHGAPSSLAAAAGDPAVLNLDVAESVAQVFKVLADPTRARIVYALSQREWCVCELSRALGLEQPAVSHQLRTLRLLRLVTTRRAGTTVFYRLADPHVLAVLQLVLDHIQHN